MIDGELRERHYTYACRLYEIMLTQAVKEVDYENGEDALVWRGFITKVARSVGIPDGVYKRIIDGLMNMGCLEQLERGGRGTGSAYLLHGHPTPEAWLATRDRPLTLRFQPAILEARIRELEGRLDGIDIKQALVELQEQIQSLSLSTTQNNE